MKTLTAAMLRLYPRSWRERYGVELETLLADVRPRGRDLVDVLFGAAREHLRVFLHRPAWQILAAFVALGAFAGGGTTWFIPTVYEASSTVRVTDESDDIYTVFRYAFSDDSLRHIAQARRVYAQHGLADADILARMRRDIRVWTWRKSPRSLDVVAIGFMGDSRVAVAVTSDLVAAMADRARALRIPFTIVEEPAVFARVAPKTGNLVGAGMICGFLVGLIAAAAAKLRRDPPLARTV